ncbi:MAG: phosphoribosylformylglycinamidine synthase I [Candidatus Latescibacterota bacterium]|nr:MAG: phosphoribosylformylglycinamidine synthase I [Candidatus Latescibacterota bacterium]
MTTQNGHVIVIQFPGVNCEYETVRALESVGLRARIARWNARPEVLRDAAAIVLPGGFSYQDRIRAGVVAAKDQIMDSVLEAASRGVPVMGICNGAQILVEAGAVPGYQTGAIDLALAPNDMPDRSGYYCTWVRLKKGPASCIFTAFFDGMQDDAGTIPIPLAHAEGRFVTASHMVSEKLGSNEGVALLYATTDGRTAESFPDNPNGSVFGIAGVTNPGGNVLALMPHPERATWLHQVPRRVGGRWAKTRESARAESLFTPGPGRGFFESLRKGLAQ